MTGFGGLPGPMIGRLLLYLGFGVVAGLAGAAATTLVLLAFPGGFDPVVTAFSAVRGSQVSVGEAVLGYLALGVACGLAYVVVWPVLDVTRPLGIYPSFLGGGLFGGGLYLAFAVLALPRSDVDRARWKTVRNAWFLAAALFALSLSHGFAVLEAFVL